MNKKLFNWYIARFKKMSLIEIVTMRLYRNVRNRFMRSNAKAPLYVKLQTVPFDSRFREAFAERFPVSKENLTKEADNILKNKITIFDKEIILNEDIDWNKGVTDSDPKYVWELNRQQFLPALAKAFFLTKDEKYAVKTVNFIESWINQNPPFKGVNWRSMIELSLRQISWLWALKYMADYKGLSDETDEAINKITVSLYAQTKYVSMNLSLYSSANNHLIAELASMAIIGAHINALEFVNKAVRLMEGQIDRQILPDGVPAEQSTCYHAYTMEYFLLSAIILKDFGIEIPQKILKGLHRGAIFFESILDNEGIPPQIGDSDSGCVLRLSNDYSNYKSILNLTAYITDDSSLLQNDVGKDEKAFWLIGPDNFDRLCNKAGKINPICKNNFDKGGYYILNNILNKKEINIIFDCGHIGMLPIMSHGHIDALSFVLYVNGASVFIDPGTYVYYKNDFWRNYFRGTSAHNTIRIDGLDQCELKYRFLIEKPIRVNCAGFKENESVSGIHFGYARLKNPVSHKRRIDMDSKEQYLKIEDFIDTKGRHLVEQFFHLDASCDIKDCGNNLFKIISPSAEIDIIMDKGLEVSIYRGDSVLPLGWQSFMYGAKIKTFSIAGRADIKGPKTFVTRIKF